MKIDAHLEIHFAEKQQFAFLSVNFWAYLGAGTVITRRSVGVVPFHVLKTARARKFISLINNVLPFQV